MKFVYLLYPPNKYYKIRDEQFIIDGLKKYNHKVEEINRFFRFNIIIKCLFNKPDALILSSLKIGKKVNFLLFFIKKMKIPIYWWYFDSANTDNNRYKNVINVAKNTSIFFNRDMNNFNDYKKNNINPIWLDQAVPNILSKYKNNGNNYNYDLGFFGSLSGVHKERARSLKEIDDKFNLVIYTKDVKDFEKMGFKNVKNFVFKDKIPELVSNIKIVLVFNSSCSSPYYWSDRIHIMLGSKAFCLTEFTEGIEKSYLNNVHHVIFNEFSELEEKVHYWIKQKQQRITISENAYKYAHEHHSYYKRVEEFLNYL